MNAPFNRTVELDWRVGLRQAALAASIGGRRGWWLASVAGGAVLAFVILLSWLPGSAGMSSSGLSEVQQAVKQGQRLSSGSLSSEGLFPMAYSLWLLVVSRFTNDIIIAARMLSGLSAVLVLFLAYQLCFCLSDPEKGSEQATFALLALALSPTFFLISAGGGADMPYAALLLAALLFVERAAGSDRPVTPMALGGLVAGLSLLIRPLSLLVPLAVVLWLWRSRPFGDETPAANLRPGLVFSAAFAVASAPQLLLGLVQQKATIPWGLAELLSLLERLTSSPLSFLGGSAWAVAQYAAADDVERLSTVAASWSLGAWGELPAAIIALAPTILKLLGAAGLVVLCWRERFELAIARATLPALLLGLIVLGSGLGIVHERSMMPLQVLLIVFAFAGMPALIHGALAGVLSLGVVGMLLFHQVGVGFPVHLAASFRASQLVSHELQLGGAQPSAVMSSTWAFYDTGSPWRERYLPIPPHVSSQEGLVAEMRRQGASYLVFERQHGAASWPQLASLMETERPRPGLRALTTAFRTEESPPNTVAIYKLER